MEHSAMWILVAQISLLFCLVHTDEEKSTEDDVHMYQNDFIPMNLHDKAQLPIVIQKEQWGRRPLRRVSSNLDDFPPGRPSEANIYNICRKNRTIVSYGPYNLPQTGYGHLSRQGRAINVLEEGFTKCCLQSESLGCADKLWEKVLSTFCEEEQGVKTASHVCCNKRGLSLLYKCFADMAPFPQYDQEVEELDLSTMTEDTLEKLCGDYRLFNKTKQLLLLVSGLRDACCALPQDRKLGCAEEQKKKYFNNLCYPTKELWGDHTGCCMKSEQERDQCFSHSLQNVTVSITQRRKGE